MIDLKDLRTNIDKYKKWATDKWVHIDRDRFVAIDEEVREYKSQLDQLNAERNISTASIEKAKRAGEDMSEVIASVKKLKVAIADMEEKLSMVTREWQTLLYMIPSPAFDDVIVWSSDEENEVDAYIWKKKEFDFEPKPHREILENKWYLDQERAVKLSWSRFQILRWNMVKLQFALINRLLNKLAAKWFEQTLIPQLVKEDALFTTGFLPNESSNLYRVNPKTDTEQTEWEEDDLWLIGTAEVALVSQHMNEVFLEEQLPKRYVGFSSCYRREAGTYGKDTKGLIRLHQFDKVEMVSFVDPEHSQKEHEFLREIEEEIFSDLWLHFQRINICTWDLGAPAAKKYDLEAWFPGIWSYKEVTSTSNTTDFQTRRGNIKMKKDGKKTYVHSLNGTAVALWRCLWAIVETYQTKEWDIRIPDVLQPFMWVDII